MTDSLCALLADAKTIAIIGAKDKEGTDVDRVGRYLIHQGYTVFPVHPTRKNVWGKTTYTHIGAIAEPIDIVCAFRASEFCLAHADECMQLPRLPLCFWMQIGISNTIAQLRLEKKGIQVVSNRRIMVEHATCFGKTVAPHGSQGIGQL